MPVVRPLPILFVAVALVTVAASLVLGGCDFSRDGEGTPEPVPDSLASDGAAADAGAEDTWTPVCTAGEATCEGMQRKVCTGRGDGWTVFDCPPGSGCVAGACEIAHPRIVFVFDTSSSMFAPAGDGQGSAFEPPECGSIESPGSRIDASKALFQLLFSEPLPTSPRMALFRFPQRAAAAPQCEAAFWTGMSRMSGDDDSHVVSGTRGSWFRNGLRQVLVVPLRTGDDDGREAIVEWLDGEERVLLANKECTSDAACSDGFCSDGTCWREIEPELRAGGGTPLGRTMFYAGEYYRTMVLVDGKPCSHDGECGSPGYLCGDDGACHDPLASCRANHIIVFSDGDETANPDADDFYNPLVQARRLRYGLGCSASADCLAGATCSDDGTCVPPDPVPEELPDDWTTLARIDTTLRAVDPEGAQRLVLADGRSASIQVHALDVWGNRENRLIAWLGGGEYVSGTLSNPDTVLWAMDLLLRSKGAETVCR